MQFGLSHWRKKWRLVGEKLMHYIINTKSLPYGDIFSSWKNIGQNSPSASKLDCENLFEMSTQEGS